MGHAPANSPASYRTEEVASSPNRDDELPENQLTPPAEEEQQQPLGLSPIAELTERSSRWRDEGLQIGPLTSSAGGYSLAGSLRDSSLGLADQVEDLAEPGTYTRILFEVSSTSLLCSCSPF